MFKYQNYCSLISIFICIKLLSAKLSGIQLNDCPENVGIALHNPKKKKPRFRGASL
jgi:hypothetical protein